jgi:DNA topoisomerase I
MDDSAGISASVLEAVEVAKAAGLVYVRDTDPGIRRRRRNAGFDYFAPDGSALTSQESLARIQALAVPPAYEDVWICTNPRGHLQATGRDARARKQYRYHAEWRRVRDDAKFERMIEFGDALPCLRRRLRRDLALHGLPRDKVLAVVVGLLDVTRIRIGNAAYARDNASYGLTTLRNRHARFVRDGRLVLEFRGKGGAAHEVPVDDRRLVRLVRRCQQLPGQQLFQFVDDEGVRHPVTSDQVNEYLRDTMGADFTAKDFRTWGASLRAIALLARTPLPESGAERACKACIMAAIKTVAAELAHTPTVCRKSYINPVVFDAWRRGTLHESVPSIAAGSPRKMEQVALDFLRCETRRSGKRRFGRKSIVRTRLNAVDDVARAS